MVASGLELSLSWRPPSWTQHLQKVRPDVWDKVPASARACAQEARIPGPFVAPRCCALMPVLTWCLLTRSLRVLAGQTGKPLQVHGHAEARTRGEVPGTRACGPVSVAGHPDMCANGAFVQILRPGPRARSLHIAMRTPLQPPRRGGHVDMRMSVCGGRSGERCCAESAQRALSGV